MIAARDWLRLHMALECITLDAAGDLVRLPCSNPDTIHRLYLARHAGGHEVFFRHDLPGDLRADLSTLPVDSLFHDHEWVKAIFAASGAPCPGMHVGRSYVYPDTFEPVDLPDVTYLPENDTCTLTINETLVSMCVSIRHNDRAAEAYVHTHEDYRQRGYGSRVVLAWAQRVRRSGRVPFYSHLIANHASQRLAEALGFVWYVDDVGYE
jgi:GNAT superfamily N-acetyltransferase